MKLWLNRRNSLGEVARDIGACAGLLLLCGEGIPRLEGVNSVPPCAKADLQGVITFDAGGMQFSRFPQKKKRSPGL